MKNIPKSEDIVTEKDQMNPGGTTPWKKFWNTPLILVIRGTECIYMQLIKFIGTSVSNVRSGKAMEVGLSANSRNS